MVKAGAMSGLTVHVTWTLDKSSVMLTGSDAERAVFCKREPLKGCKKTSGPRVGVECGKGGVTADGARVSRFRLIYPFSFDISLVEGDIGICRQHSRVALPVTHAPARFWSAVLTDYRHKRNFSWSSTGDKEKTQRHMNVFHRHLRELFVRFLFLLATVSLARCHKKHRKVTNKSFGTRYAEGIYFHSDSVTPSVWMFDSITAHAVMDKVRKDSSPFSFYSIEFKYQILKSSLTTRLGLQTINT
jgi:hypothetical protein